MANEELKNKFTTGSIPTGADFGQLIDTVGQKGPKGDLGAPGKDGERGAQGEDGTPGLKGAPGEDGADGFGTQEQYDAIIARLDALETVE